MPNKSAIGKLASAKTKVEFAEELSSLTAFTSQELKDLFPLKSDREEWLELAKIVNSDATDKDKQAELVAKIGKVSSAVIKIGKRFATGI